MTKPREIFKGKVKRLLRAQEDMGQLYEPAVQHCVSALEAFVHDLGRRMKKQAEDTGVDVVTPIELKRCVLASTDLQFLHGKVAAIDESDARYHKPTRKRKAPVAQAGLTTPDDSKKKNNKKENVKATAATGTKKSKTSVAVAATASRASTDQAASSAAAAAPTAAATAAAIEEDDNYDSSDSE